MIPTVRYKMVWYMRFFKEVSLYPIVSLIFIVAILPFVSGVIPTVRFPSERIDVHVYADEIVVDGYYFYRNPLPFPVVQGFTIPFPIDKDHPEPSELYVERLTPVRKDIQLRHVFGNAGFEVYFSAHKEIEVRVTYRQKAGGMNGTYILKTTQPWGRPLNSGLYTLYPHGTVIESSNYPLDRPGKAPGFYKTGFMPDKDWQFTWRRGS